MSWDEAVQVVRNQLVPAGFTPLTWRPHIPETTLDMMKSIVATYIFRNMISAHQANGIDFNKFFYIPSVDTITNQDFHEREDHNHVLKRVAKHVRDGGVPGIDLKRFYEAMLDTKNDLTEAALRGDRKQSVGDAEKLLSFAVADFFRSKHYLPEERFVRIVARWHEASDGRGVSQDKRQEANHDMLAYITSIWMPWHETCPGLKNMDINV